MNGLHAFSRSLKIRSLVWQPFCLIFCQILCLTPCLSFLGQPMAWAADAEVKVTLDRSTIAQDETVALRFEVQVEGNGNVEKIDYQAPEFDVVNEYNGTQIQSYYENGRFGMRQTKQITHVLRPKKMGRFQVANPRVLLNGKWISGKTLSVQVIAGGQGTPPPRGYGSSPGVGLRGAGNPGRSPGFFIRAEIDKAKAYKGEQVIVSYYLYAKNKISRPEVLKYPMLDGFLREELEVPAAGGRLVSEQTVLQGVPYGRILLARYAAYPLKEGKLRIDTMEGRVVYFSQESIFDSDDDIFGMFRGLMPKSSVAGLKSEPIFLEVQGLPSVNRPPAFTGGVGDFTVSSVVDRYDLKTGEAVTLTVKIEGRGNTSAIDLPPLNLSKEIQLYESKAKTSNAVGGIGQKIFETLLMPQVPGRLTIPAVEIAFFDPEKGDYVIKKTEPISINVTGDALPEKTSPANVASSGATNSALGGLGSSGLSEDLSAAKPFGLKPPGGGASEYTYRGHPWWRWLFWLSCLVMALFAVTVVKDGLSKAQKLRQESAGDRALEVSKSWRALIESSKKLKGLETKAAWIDVVKAYERLSGAMYDILDREFSVSSRSISRKDLKVIIVDDNGIVESLWSRIEKLLEFAETVRFAASAGVITQDEAKRSLENWVTEGQALDTALLAFKKNHKKEK